jgi:hypothetical protein
MRRMRFACWTIKATDTHSDYVKRIAFLRKKLLGKRASTLRHSILSLSLLTAYFIFLLHFTQSYIVMFLFLVYFMHAFPATF